MYILIGRGFFYNCRVEYRTDDNSVSKRLLSTYVAIQNGLIEDKKGWMVEIK